MTTSGTVGQTTIDVSTLMEHAARRCGVLATSIGGEQQLAARESLFMMLSYLANRGLSLWCVQKDLIAFVPGQTSYPLPTGRVDVLKCLFRLPQYNATSTVISGQTAVATFGAATQVSTIGVVPLTGATSNLVVETSPDGSAWTSLTTIAAFTPTVGTTNWFDMDPSTTQLYWRVRETVAGSLNASSVEFGSTNQEIPMGPLSRDEYLNLPNKQFTSNRPLSFWFNKLIAPQVVFWPQPSDATALAVVWTQRHIQDVGSLTNTLDVPQRWLEGITNMWAHRIGLELPKIDPNRLMMLKGLADEALTEAENGETDGMPIRMAPNLRAYSR
jgi:hypothetical protein